MQDVRDARKAREDRPGEGPQQPQRLPRLVPDQRIIVLEICWRRRGSRCAQGKDRRATESQSRRTKGHPRPPHVCRCNIHTSQVAVIKVPGSGSTDCFDCIHSVLWPCTTAISYVWRSDQVSVEEFRRHGLPDERNRSTADPTPRTHKARDCRPICCPSGRHWHRQSYTFDDP